MRRPAPLAAALALPLLTACGAQPERHLDLAADQRIGAFAYAPPGAIPASGQGWRTILYPPGPDGGLLHSHIREGGAGSLQVQLSLFRPVRPVATEAELVAWAAGAAGARRSWPAPARGPAPCAAYAQRFDQTFSGGGPPARWATVDEHGLFCAHPADAGRILQLRVLERTAPDGTTGAAEALAREVLPRLRALP